MNPLTASLVLLCVALTLFSVTADSNVWSTLTAVVDGNRDVNSRSRQRFQSLSRQIDDISDDLDAADSNDWNKAAENANRDVNSRSRRRLKSLDKQIDDISDDLDDVSDDLKDLDRDTDDEFDKIFDDLDDSEQRALVALQIIEQLEKKQELHRQLLDKIIERVCEKKEEEIQEGDPGVDGGPVDEADTGNATAATDEDEMLGPQDMPAPLDDDLGPDDAPVLADNDVTTGLRRLMALADGIEALDRNLNSHVSSPTKAPSDSTVPSDQTSPVPAPAPSTSATQPEPTVEPTANIEPTQEPLESIEPTSCSEGSALVIAALVAEIDALNEELDDLDDDLDDLSDDVDDVGDDVDKQDRKNRRNFDKVNRRFDEGAEVQKDLNKRLSDLNKVDNLHAKLMVDILLCLEAEAEEDKELGVSDGPVEENLLPNATNATESGVSGPVEENLQLNTTNATENGTNLEDRIESSAAPKGVTMGALLLVIVSFLIVL